MTRGLVARIAAVLAAAGTAIVVVWLLVHSPTPSPNLPALNDAVRTAERH